MFLNPSSTRLRQQPASGAYPYDRPSSTAATSQLQTNRGPVHAPVAQYPDWQSYERHNQMKVPYDRQGYNIDDPLQHQAPTPDLQLKEYVPFKYYDRDNSKTRPASQINRNPADQIVVDFSQPQETGQATERAEDSGLKGSILVNTHGFQADHQKSQSSLAKAGNAQIHGLSTPQQQQTIHANTASQDVLTHVNKLIEAAEQSPQTYPLSSLPGGRRIGGQIPIDKEKQGGTLNLHINNYSVSYRDVQNNLKSNGPQSPVGKPSKDANYELESQVIDLVEKEANRAASSFGARSTLQRSIERPPIKNQVQIIKHSQRDQQKSVQSSGALLAPTYPTPAHHKLTNSYQSSLSSSLLHANHKTQPSADIQVEFELDPTQFGNQKPCYCNGQPVPDNYSAGVQTSHQRLVPHLTSVQAGVQTVPTPKQQQPNQKKMKMTDLETFKLHLANDPPLSKYDIPASSYLNKEFRATAIGVENDAARIKYDGLNDFEKEKLSYKQYNNDMSGFMRDYTIPLRDKVLFTANTDTHVHEKHNTILLQKVLQEITNVGAQGGLQGYENRGDEKPLLSLNKELFELKADRILPAHPLFKNFSLISLKCFLQNSLLLRVQRDQCLYKQGDPAEERTYIVIVGKIALKAHIGDENKFDTIGHVTAGDTLGEEGAYEVGEIYRKETAVGEEDSYVLEILKDSLMVVQEYLRNENLSLDWFTFNNFMKKQWVQKRSWRLYKEQEKKHVKLF